MVNDNASGKDKDGPEHSLKWLNVDRAELSFVEDPPSKEGKIYSNGLHQIAIRVRLIASGADHKPILTERNYPGIAAIVKQATFLIYRDNGNKLNMNRSEDPEAPIQSWSYTDKANGFNSSLDPTTGRPKRSTGNNSNDYSDPDTNQISFVFYVMCPINQEGLIEIGAQIDTPKEDDSGTTAYKTTIKGPSILRIQPVKPLKYTDEYVETYEIPQEDVPCYIDKDFKDKKKPLFKRWDYKFRFKDLSGLKIMKVEFEGDRPSFVHGGGTEKIAIAGRGGWFFNYRKPSPDVNEAVSVFYGYVWLFNSSFHLVEEVEYPKPIYYALPSRPDKEDFKVAPITVEKDPNVVTFTVLESFNFKEFINRTWPAPNIWSIPCQFTIQDQFGNYAKFSAYQSIVNGRCTVRVREGYGSGAAVAT